MIIRLATPGDYAEVGEITVAAYEPFLLGPHDPYGDRLRDAASRAEQAALWVAVDDDDTLLGSVTDPPAGSAYRELAADDEGEFRMLAVAPRAQGRGVGVALARHVVDRSRSAGHRGVVISSLPQMAAAHRLYGRLGFRRDNDRDWYPLPDVLLIAFRLDLEPLP
ncbi:MAG: GNAT family N-acetyltransferase [Nocardioides sp.]